MTTRGSRRTGLITGVIVTFALLVSGGVVFGMTDDTVRRGEHSHWVSQFVEPVGDATADAALELEQLPSTFGGEGDARTLVLYDSTRADPEAELDGLAAANLATHFGQVELLPVTTYRSGQLSEFDAVIYIGSDYEEEIPLALVDDIRAGETPALWAGANFTALRGDGEQSTVDAFVDAYGWDPDETALNTADTVTTIRYDGTALKRDARITNHLVLPKIVDADRIEVLGTAVCGDADAAQACRGADGTEFPWAIRSANLTYVGEVPFDYMEEDSRYLAFADLLYDLIAPETEAVRAAAVRIEDVGPESDPASLRRIADYFAERGIPFQVAVMPIHIARVAPDDPERYYGISLLEAPDVVAALQYMQERGGTLIQHGTTHQYGAEDNPYDSSTGADFEFFRAQCSATEQEPYALEPCEQTSWVQLTGPVSRDAVGDHRARLEAGRDVMIDAGLGRPRIFEVPHYAASPNAYAAIDDLYDARYERTQYFAGLASGHDYSDSASFTQFFPYRVHDIYGGTVLPENLGNMTTEMQNNHEARPPELLVEHARRNLVVRESTASFFFHPFLDLDDLDAIVSGIEGLGYTFVSAEQLP